MKLYFTGGDRCVSFPANYCRCRYMRKYVFLLWMLSAVGVVVYHYNRGQDGVRREQVYRHFRKIKAMEGVGKPDWHKIAEEYGRLASELPASESAVTLHKIRLAKCRAQLEGLELRDAIDQLQILLDTVVSEYGENAQLTRAVRETMGRAQFMAGWVLLQIGAPETEYRARFERSRQIFRYLAEHENADEYRRYQKRINKAFSMLADGNGGDEI